MVTDFDIIDFLDMLTGRSVALLSVFAAGVVLAGLDGKLQVAAASSETAGLVELFQIQHDQGPCLDCFRTGRAVSAAGLGGPGQRWPRFAAAAIGAGFRTVQAAGALVLVQRADLGHVTIGQLEAEDAGRGSIWNTPNPGCGMDRPLFSVICGTAVTTETLLQRRGCGHAADPLSLPRTRPFTRARAAMPALPCRYLQPKGLVA